MDTERNLTRSLPRVLFVTACVLAVPLVASRVAAGVGWNLFDFVLVGVLVGGTGGLYELAAGRPGSGLAALIAAAVAAVGGAAVVLGEADDAPGLILIGLALVATSAAIGLRGARNGALERHASASRSV